MHALTFSWVLVAPRCTTRQHRQKHVWPFAAAAHGANSTRSTRLAMIVASNDCPGRMMLRNKLTRCAPVTASIWRCWTCWLCSLHLNLVSGIFWTVYLRAVHSGTFTKFAISTNALPAARFSERDRARLHVLIGWRERLARARPSGDCLQPRLCGLCACALNGATRSSRAAWFFSARVL